MKQFKAFQTSMSALGASLGVGVAEHVSKWVENTFPSAQLPVSILVISISYVVFNLGSESLIRRSRFIRQTLLRSQFVEGVWREIVLSPNGDAYTCITQIQYNADSGNISYSGRDFSLDGDPIGSFRTDMIDVTWPEIKYTYKWIRNSRVASRLSQLSLDSEGYGVLQFSNITDKSHNIPRFYQGYFQDFKNGVKCSFQGWKVTDKKDEKMFLQSINNPVSMAATMRDFALEHKSYWKKNNRLLFWRT